MDIKGQTKKFFLNILNKIEDHIVNVIASIIIIVVLASCIIFWKWLNTMHSLKTYGWLWILGLLLLSGLPIILFFLIKKKQLRGIYTDENDIKNILGSQFRQVSIGRSGMPKTRLTIEFSYFDKSSNVKSGSSKKHLETIANNLGYHTTQKGEETIVFECEKRNKPGFLDAMLDGLE
jgi:magnesium-transporting ATPase (P-type)